MFRSFDRHRTFCVVNAGEPLIRSLVRDALEHGRVQHPVAGFSAKGLEPDDAGARPQWHDDPVPFRYHPGPLQDGECVNDPGHDWITMHGAWNNGNNDNWLPAQANESPLVGNVPVTMGYYTRHDIPIHYLLADAFMICDQYHCSLLGGTTPNRLYWMSATIDPSGQNGGPQLVEPNVQPVQHFSWTIMPENLSAARVSWKVKFTDGRIRP